MEIDKLFLYARGFLYLFAAAQMFMIFLVLRPKVRAHWFVLALLILLAIGGLSSFAGVPEIGRWMITYGVTILLIALNVALSVYLIFRK